MKLTTYTSQLSSSGTTTTSSSSSVAMDKNMYGDGGKGFAAMSDAIGAWAKVIKQKQDEDDQQAAFNAINEYNKQTYSMMYEGDNALMNVTGGNAANIGQQYIQGEQQIRSAVMDGVKFHNGKNKQALQNMLDRQAISHFQTVGKREYQQGIVAQKETLGLGVQNAQLAIQKNYGDADVVNTQAAYLRGIVNNSFKYMSPEEKEILMKDTLGKFYSSGIQAAITANDNAAYDSLMKAAQGYITPQQYENFSKVHTAFIKDESMRKNVRAAVDGNKTWKQFEAELRNGTTTDGGRSLVDIMRVDMANAPYSLNEENSKAFFGTSMKGTSCMATIGFGPLKGTDYSGLYNVDQAIAVAKKNKQLIAGDSGYTPKPGDLAVVNNGNHIVMVREDGGTIQNGESGKNGKGGVWESELSPEKMFGSVKYYIRTSDYNGSSGSTRPYTEKEIDQYRNMFAAYENQKKHEKTVFDLASFKNNKEYIYNTFINPDGGKMRPIDEALEWARKDGGSDLDKCKKNEDAVKDWYKIYGVNTTNGGGGPKLDEADLDDIIIQGISKKELRHGLAERGFNVTQVNKALRRWEQHYERKGTFSVDKNNILSIVMNGKKNNFTPQELALRQGAWRWILNEAAKIEATENKGQPIEDYQLLDLAEKAKKEMNMGGSLFPNNRLVPYAMGTNFNYARASFLGYRVNPAGDGVHWNVERPDEAGDRISAWLTAEQMAEEVDEKWNNIFKK